ncbi:MAG: hypothetical protein AB1631_16185, partial [Acidobacteriota bacterium]
AIGLKKRANKLREASVVAQDYLQLKGYEAEPIEKFWSALKKAAIFFSPTQIEIGCWMERVSIFLWLLLMMAQSNIESSTVKWFQA